MKEHSFVLAAVIIVAVAAYAAARVLGSVAFFAASHVTTFIEDRRPTGVEPEPNNRPFLFEPGPMLSNKFVRIGLGPNTFSPNPENRCGTADLVIRQIFL